MFHRAGLGLISSSEVCLDIPDTCHVGHRVVHKFSATVTENLSWFSKHAEYMFEEGGVDFCGGCLAEWHGGDPACEDIDDG